MKNEKLASELYFVDANGDLSDAELHEDMLSNTEASAYADKSAAKAALNAGIDPQIVLSLDEDSRAIRAARQEGLSGLGASAVRERHLDFILQEEFYANPAFLRSFLNLCQPEKFLETAPLLVEALSSVYDKHGETDVLLAYRLGEDSTLERRALLIENKIDAAFQVNQAKRYKSRGSEGEGIRWTSYHTCLVAPKAYIREGHGFDYAINLEDLSPLLSPDSLSRRNFKQSIIRRAIDDQASRGLKTEDTQVTESRLKYFQAYEIFKKHLRDGNDLVLDDVKAPLPRRAWSGDNWFEFRGAGLGPKVYVNHKSKSGFLDLTFPSTDAGHLRSLTSLENGMSIEQTGKSAAIRLVVPPLNPYIDLEVQSSDLDAAFIALHRLVTFYKALPSLQLL